MKTKTVSHFVFSFFAALAVTASAIGAQAGDLKVGDAAPDFKAKTHEGTDFELKSRAGQWTVLYFYPKAGTPGCTKQACAFRDSIAKIRALGGDVIGVSADTVADQAKFHKEHRLNFPLIADANGDVVKLYGAKIMGLTMSKRWTFIVDPKMKIRAIEKDVDPVLDSQKVADLIAKMKQS